MSSDQQVARVVRIREVETREEAAQMAVIQQSNAAPGDRLEITFDALLGDLAFVAGAPGLTQRRSTAAERLVFANPGTSEMCLRFGGTFPATGSLVIGDISSTRTCALPQQAVPSSSGDSSTPRGLSTVPSAVGDVQSDSQALSDHMCTRFQAAARGPP